MKFLFLLFCLVLMMLSSCSSMTILRTKEIKEATDSSAASVNRRIDSLMLAIDSLKSEHSKNMSRLKADFSELNYKIAEQNNRSEARMEEISYRLDRLMGITQQKSGAKKSGAKEKSDDKSRSSEMEALYNTSRSDYLKGAYAVAYNGFKEIYETLKTGEMAENALYWMGMCMMDAGKRENAETLFKTLLDKYPQSSKVCTVDFKLASMAEEAGNKASQKAYLEKLLGTEQCVASNEFQRAADILPTLN